VLLTCRFPYAQAEKNAFCEKLATVAVATEADVAWIEGTRRTLAGLLSHARKDDSVILPGAMKNVNQSVEGLPLADSKAFPAMSLGSRPRDSISSDVDRKKAPAVDDEDDGFEPLESTPDHGTETKRKDSVKSTLIVGEDTQIFDSKPVAKSDEQIWAQVGGGLAVLGAAVVGGVALTMRHHTRGDKPHERRRPPPNHSKSVHRKHEKDSDWDSL